MLEKPCYSVINRGGLFVALLCKTNHVCLLNLHSVLLSSFEIRCELRHISAVSECLNHDSVICQFSEVHHETFVMCMLFHIRGWLCSCVALGWSSRPLALYSDSCNE